MVILVIVGVVRPAAVKVMYVGAARPSPRPTRMKYAIELGDPMPSEITWLIFGIRWLW
jgi:hypothetical protein